MTTKKNKKEKAAPKSKAKVEQVPAPEFEVTVDFEKLPYGSVVKSKKNGLFYEFRGYDDSQIKPEIVLFPMIDEEKLHPDAKEPIRSAKLELFELVWENKSEVVEEVKEEVKVEKVEPAPKEKKSKLTRLCYSDEDLAEFKTLIESKLEAAEKDAKFLQETIDENKEGITQAQGMEEGITHTMTKEESIHLKERQEKYIQLLKNALERIKNKTYGICRSTGNLISKERLLAVPHATLSAEAAKATDLNEDAKPAVKFNSKREPKEDKIEEVHAEEIPHEDQPANDQDEMNNLPAVIEHMEKAFNVRVRHDYTQDEMIQKGDLLAHANESKRALEDEIKAIKSEFKSKIDAEQAIIDKVSKQLTQKYEMRTVEACLCKKDFDAGVKIYYSIRDRIELHREKMTAADYQTKIPLEQEIEEEVF